MEKENKDKATNKSSYSDMNKNKKDNKTGNKNTNRNKNKDNSKSDNKNHNSNKGNYEVKNASNNTNKNASNNTNKNGSKNNKSNNNGEANNSSKKAKVGYNFYISKHKLDEIKHIQKLMDALAELNKINISLWTPREIAKVYCQLLQKVQQVRVDDESHRKLFCRCTIEAFIQQVNKYPNNNDIYVTIDQMENDILRENFFKIYVTQDKEYKDLFIGNIQHLDAWCAYKKMTEQEAIALKATMEMFDAQQVIKTCLYLKLQLSSYDIKIEEESTDEVEIENYIEEQEVVEDSIEIAEKNASLEVVEQQEHEYREVIEEEVREDNIEEQEVAGDCNTENVEPKEYTCQEIISDQAEKDNVEVIEQKDNEAASEEVENTKLEAVKQVDSDECSQGIKEKEETVNVESVEQEESKCSKADVMIIEKAQKIEVSEVEEGNREEGNEPLSNEGIYKQNIIILNDQLKEVQLKVKRLESKNGQLTQEKTILMNRYNKLDLEKEELKKQLERNEDIVEELYQANSKIKEENTCLEQEKEEVLIKLAKIQEANITLSTMMEKGDEFKREAYKKRLASKLQLEHNQFIDIKEVMEEGIEDEQAKDMLDLLYMSLAEVWSILEKNDVQF